MLKQNWIIERELGRQHEPEIARFRQYKVEFDLGKNLKLVTQFLGSDPDGYFRLGCLKRLLGIFRGRRIYGRGYYS